MPSIWKRLSHQPKIEEYHFPNADELNELDFADAPQPEEEEHPLVGDNLEETAPEETPSFADIHSAAMLQEAREQAENLLKQAQQEADQLLQNAKDEGYAQGRAEGYAEGVSEGTRQAKEEVLQQQNEKLETLTNEVQKFLEKANTALQQQLDENAVELRDLAIAIAEKVIGVSLDSSADVIERMIRMAIEKRKRCEWVQIYVSNHSAHKLVELSPVLTTSFAALSDHVRIVPMKDDEPGACIIEMPGEIIDASVSTQIENIRSALSETPLDQEKSSI